VLIFKEDVAMLKHVAQICTEFYQILKTAAWWEGKAFRNPTTGKRVKFKSLPPEEQKRLNALHKQKSSKRSEKQKARLQRVKDREQRRKDKKEERARRKKEKEDRFKNITPETHPNFFTDNGKRLDTRHGFRPGWKVEKNPDWDPKKDNSYYAKEFNPKTGKAVHYYTEDYMRKHNKIKFANVKRFGELLPQIRQKYTAALTSENPRDKVYSTAIALVDQASMRIGNKNSEEDDVRGLHNLLTKHIKITKSDQGRSKVELNYTGKGKVSQKHEFDVSPTIASNLNDLIQNKGPEDSIFTWEKDGKKIRIAPRLTNKFLKRQLGSNVTIHKFRHHHATEKVKTFLDQIDTTKISLHDVKVAINDSAEYAAEYLGNTAKVARLHYIDPTVYQEFLKRASVKRSLKEVLKGKASSNSMTKQAMDKKFKFVVDENLKELTPEEQTFQDNIEAMKLEDLQPYEDIDFTNDNLKL
jgi:DNA topoisomerase IB